MKCLTAESAEGAEINYNFLSRRTLRDEVVIVSKIGYLQGQNLALSRERKQHGRPFPELVEYAEGLEHCIHHWLNFGTYERWRQVKTGNLLPRIQGVMDFLEPHARQNADVSKWMVSHRPKIEDAFEAVASIYAEQAAHKVDRIRRAVAAVDRDWAAEGTLSQKALRALRSTPGVSCVLVGMRREAYVSDIIAGLQHPVQQVSRFESWLKLTEALAKTLY